MTRSHRPASSVVRMNPRRWGDQKYSSGRWTSWAMSSEILFSKPSPARFENGMLFGSEQTRSGGGAPPTSADNATTATIVLKAEHIDGASRSRVLLDLFHRADDAERRVRIVGGDIRERDRAHPAADARVDGDVLPAIRADVRDWVRDDTRGDVKLPKLGAGAGVGCFEPAVHRAVEHDIAAGREHTAVDRKPLFLRAPRLPVVRDVPRHELALIAAGPAIHPHVGAEIRRPRDGVRVDAF